MYCTVDDENRECDVIHMVTMVEVMEENSAAILSHNPTRMSFNKEKKLFTPSSIRLSI